MPAPVESTVTSVMSLILNGDSRSVIGVLILAIMFLFYDRVRLINEIKQRDSEERKDREALIDLIEKYHKTSIENNQALNSVMIVLTRIREIGKEGLDGLLEKHHKTSIENNQALNSVMIVLTRIEGKFSRNP